MQSLCDGSMLSYDHFGIPRTCRVSECTCTVLVRGVRVTWCVRMCVCEFARMCTLSGIKRIGKHYGEALRT